MKPKNFLFNLFFSLLQEISLALWSQEPTRVELYLVFLVVRTHMSLKMLSFPIQNHFHSCNRVKLFIKVDIWICVAHGGKILVKHGTNFSIQIN